MIHPVLDELDARYLTVSKEAGVDEWVTTGLPLLWVAMKSGFNGSVPLAEASSVLYKSAAGYPRSFDQGVALADLSNPAEREQEVRRIAEDGFIQSFAGAPEDMREAAHQECIAYFIGAVVGGLAYGVSRNAARRLGDERPNRVYGLAGEYMRQIPIGGPYQSLLSSIPHADDALSRLEASFRG